ncbi:phosphate acyltransferase [[Collinsella] massiliensis]|uniref:Phosphate acetyltransferase n=2 Tax=Coriobacteriaceae TaxID=84107 RepID=A0A1Y3XUZ1_9ACTN|nr:phosphate acyltransferase [[Collinsella] massiliensis]OUN89302.1 phosphate acetyltransferase [[Collinsella] massiliensis]
MADFMSDIIARAAETPRRIGLSEVESPDVLRLAQRIVETEIGVPVLVGDAAASRAVAAEAGVSTEGFEYVDNADEAVVSAIVERYTAAYDDFSQKACTRRAKDNLLCAMLLLKLGDVDGVASGKECPTGDVVAAAMGIVGLAEGVASPSSLGIAEIPGFEGPQGEFLGLADCAITVQPGVEELAGIAIASADTAATLLGWEPRVALLSFSTMGSAQHESLETVRAAVERVHELRPDLKCDGELQLDAAIMPAVAEHKVKRPSEVAGRANILIFPNLHAGNIGVKLVQIFGHANAYGPVLQGFAKPVCDFSRSAPVDEMLGNVAMLVVRAAAQEAGE